MRIFASKGSALQLEHIGSVASVVLTARVDIRDPRTGRITRLTIPNTTADTTRVLTPAFSPERVDFDGEVVMAQVNIVSGGGKRGQTYVVLALHGPSQVLCQGYIYPAHAVNLGEFVEPGPGGGEGVIHSFDIGDPAAGAEYTTQTVPGNALWIPRGFSSVGIVTDATAGSRRLQIQYNIVATGTGSGNIGNGGLSDAIPPSSTSPMIGGNGMSLSGRVIAAGEVAAVNLPIAILPDTSTITFVTDNLAAADNYGQGFLTVEEWLVI